MGRQQIHDTTNDYVRLDVRWLQREGYLQPGLSATVNWSRRGERFAFINISASLAKLTLRYRTRRNGGEWQDKDYPVAVEWMPCRFGGNRAWFHCPVCGCRVAILYGAEVFACRQCLHLTYECQREAPHYRALYKAQAIHEKLGGTGSTDDPVFKPKGMHWRTFRCLVATMEEAESRALPPWLLRSRQVFYSQYAKSKRKLSAE